ncbi:MAG TPA: hypothetical protein ENK29_02130 [Chromatiales bacterium]|nr:hypothetical protein [Chromatiales bacterium]
MFSILAGAFDKEYTMAGTVIYVLATYALMLAAFHHARSRRFHIPVMIFIMISDLLFPIYLVLTRDWYQRLIVDEDILTFGVWVHFMLLVTLFVLYFVQIQAGRRLLRGESDPRVRQEHRAQGMGILLVRAFVILTGALLVQPADVGV